MRRVLASRAEQSSSGPWVPTGWSGPLVRMSARSGLLPTGSPGATQW